jgi:hypothetical protein
MGFWLKQAGPPPELTFCVLLSTTIFGCALTYELVRRVNWLRPLLELKPSTIATQTADWVTKVQNYRNEDPARD